MASSSHFFLQISTRSMQNGGGEGGFLHKPAFWPLLHTKVFSRLRSPGVCIPPSAHPLPMPVRITNTSHSWLGRKRRERDGSGGEKQWGRGRPRPPARPRGAAGGGGKSAPGPAACAEGAGPAGPRAGSWRGGGRMSEGEETPRLGQALSWAAGRGWNRHQPIPTPTPGPRSENETGDKAPCPGRAQ